MIHTRYMIQHNVFLMFLPQFASELSSSILHTLRCPMVASHTDRSLRLLPEQRRLGSQDGLHMSEKLCKTKCWIISTLLASSTALTLLTDRPSFFNCAHLFKKRVFSLLSSNPRPARPADSRPKSLPVETDRAGSDRCGTAEAQTYSASNAAGCGGEDDELGEMERG